ncbi:putative baseplate assembly protein, partial [Methylogaea oryzae]|uniref:putative baseplate assembly protein n=1 Tax=Methylogaea oryzae TaxID=1295382 RepID=UPI0009EA75C1
MKQDPPSSWEEWPTVAGDEQSDALFLDQAYDAVLPDSYAMVQIQESSGPTRMLRAVTATQTTQRSAYGISGKTTQLSLNQDWWKGASDSMSTLRGTLVYAQSEALSLAEQPMPASIPAQDAVGDDGKAEIELAGLYRELKSGRWVIFSGERDDIPGVSGVKSSELLMVSALKHGYDAALPGDQTHTTLTLATPPAYRYKRDTLTIYANVVKATHGETRQETLGSGDGAQALQTFTLKQPPVTFVSAANPTGVESTLKIYVNDVEWREADTLALAGPKERRFVSKTDDNANTSVVFGNGKEGARLPTGVENVKAVYRSGIGKGGNVRAEQISLLQTRALGVKSVVNPLRASGGADKESRDQARDNAPLAVMALDRLVSVQDYADFTRTFAGIGKAAARRLSDGRRELVHITIAGADDIPIDRDSDLYRNLLAALYQLGDEGLPVQVEMRELVALMLSANIKLAAGYRWEPVVTEIRAALLNEFGFQKRALGQAAQLCEIVSLIQGVAGVEYVDVDAFGGLPEKRLDLCLQAPRLLTLDELALAAKVIVTPALGAYLLRPGDIPDVAAFRQVFVDDGYEGGYAVAQYLLGRFSKGLADKLNDEAAAQSQPLCLQAALVAELNAILQGVSLYDANLFYSVPLDAETLALVVSQPQGMALVRLNRLLLDQAFSGQIT